MQKIDLHQDLIQSFKNDLEAFSNYQPNKSTISTNAGGLPSYQKCDLQVIFASVWPYKVKKEGEKTLVLNSNKELAEQYQLYEKMRKDNDIYLLKSAKELADTKYIDFRLNFIYHLKWSDSIKSIEHVEKLYKAGFRSLQFVWEFDNKLAHCHRSPEGGLTEFGIDVVEYMDKHNMIIDTANMNWESMSDVYKYTKKPIMNSHTNLKTLYNHSRNVTDEFLDLILQSDGLIGLSLESVCMSGTDNGASIDDYLDQIQYVIDRIWEDHVSLGSGYHGLYFQKIITWLETVDDITLLEEKTIERFGAKFATKFFWENTYRFLMQTL